MLIRTATRFMTDEHGATAIEYGLIAALISVAILASVVALGNSVSDLFGAGVGRAAERIGAASNSMR